MTKRRKACLDINDKFKAIIEYEKMSLVDLKKAGQNLRSLFPEHLEDTVVSELIHVKSQSATLDEAIKPTNFISLCGYEKNFIIFIRMLI